MPRQEAEGSESADSETLLRGPKVLHVESVLGLLESKVGRRGVDLCLICRCSLTTSPHLGKETTSQTQKNSSGMKKNTVGFRQ